jgi:hypothetical protein
MSCQVKDRVLSGLGTDRLSRPGIRPSLITFGLGIGNTIDLGTEIPAET